MIPAYWAQILRAVAEAVATALVLAAPGEIDQVKFDLHMHTHHSRDCTIPTAEVLRLCQLRGLDGIAVTDHNTLAGGLEAVSLAPAGFKVIPGEEVKSSEGEIIGLFLHEEIPAGLSPEETAARIRAQGGVVVIPHPFDPIRKSPLKTPALERLVAAGLVDAIEILNARMARPAHNLRGAEFAALHNLPGTAGSDGHSRPEYAHAWLDIAPFATRDEFVANLASATIGGKLSPFYVHFLSTVAKRRKKLAHWRATRAAGRVPIVK
jgi:predicted metal-dependent phosphoesterase TrpH